MTIPFHVNANSVDHIQNVKFFQIKSVSILIKIIRINVIATVFCSVSDTILLSSHNSAQIPNTIYSDSIDMLQSVCRISSYKSVSVTLNLALPLFHPLSNTHNSPFIPHHFWISSNTIIGMGTFTL